MDAIVAFVTSRDFVVNFVANLGGTLIGVWLALWFDRIKTRSEAKSLYGRMLRTSRSELGYLKPMCDSTRTQVRAGQRAGTQDNLDLPATRALLLSPLVHDKAPYSLIMVLTILCTKAAGTQTAFSRAQELTAKSAEARALLNKMQGDELDRLIKIIAIALEQLDAQLKLLGLEKTPDAQTQEVSRRLREALVPQEEAPKV